MLHLNKMTYDTLRDNGEKKKTKTKNYNKKIIKDFDQLNNCSTTKKFYFEKFQGLKKNIRKLARHNSLYHVRCYVMTYRRNTWQGLIVITKKKNWGTKTNQLKV